MNINEMKVSIVDIVDNSTGIKGVELSLKLMDQHGPNTFDMNTVFIALTSLIANKEIIELEYTLPTLEYRIKSLYFPIGTRFKVINENQG